MVVSILGLGMLALSVPACGWLTGGMPWDWGKEDKATPAQLEVAAFHARHKSEGVGCAECHSTVAESKSLETQRFMPGPGACNECHDGEDRQAPTSYPPNSRKRMAGVVFSHEAHANRKTEAGKSGCEVCHGVFGDELTADEAKSGPKAAALQKRVQERTPKSLRPRMFADCGQCHVIRKTACAQCHVEGTVAMEISTDIYDHGGGDILRGHGQVVKAQGPDACYSCHAAPKGHEAEELAKDATRDRQDMLAGRAEALPCAECHSRANIPVRPSQLLLHQVEAQLHHRGDFLPRHPIEARLDPKSCTTCHEQSTCTECHERMGIASHGAGKGRNPHPPGWVSRSGAVFHGDDARRDALTCAACHDQGAASNCVTCHKTGGPGGNPHPAGWSSDLGKASPACAPCHR